MRLEQRENNCMDVVSNTFMSLKGPLNGSFSYVVQSGRKRITYRKLDIISEFNKFENGKVCSKTPFFNELGTTTMLEKFVIKEEPHPNL